MLELFEIVELTRDHDGVPCGTRGTIMEIYDGAYEVELEGDSESTRAVPADALRLLRKGSSTGA